MDSSEWGWVTHWTDLLYQDEVWRDAQGTILRLDDMEPDYCGRVRSFCLRNAEHALNGILYEMAHGPMPSGDVAVDGFNREWDMLDAAGGDPKAWLEQADLLIALKYRSEGLPARPAVCHCGYPFIGDDGEPWDHGGCYPGIVVD
ncbi:hypothetical protein ACFYQT_39885 [Streptomyces tibetensis]|uniref:Uncharacterized protein n=1 Tax=Streptomyces tibetensis TaxID=2382123 RepID=A0ABW6NAB6_9ACTN